MSHTATLNGRGMGLKIRGSDDTIQLEASPDFVNTPYVQELTERALAYLNAGYSVHFCGPAGTGKTTLAFHVAERLGRPVTMVHGDDEFNSSDLVGRDAGYRKHSLVDNFIHSVVKSEEEMQCLWVDNRLTTACQYGQTLIYDEFNRSRPEANNALLSVLSERILNLPRLRLSGEGYLEVHPGFRAIFTSNPEEYSGVHRAQDALLDRLITIRLDHFDRETEVEIAHAKSGLPRADVEVIIDIVQRFRQRDASGHWPTIRAGIMVAQVLAQGKARARQGDPLFHWVCRDVFGGVARTRGNVAASPSEVEQVVDEVLAGSSGSKRMGRKKGEG